MRLGRNLLAGLASSVWSALLSLAVVPFYLKYLGIEAYGLVGVFVTTQSLLQLLDLGLAPAINREVARGVATGDLGEAKELLRTLAVIYWAMAGVVILIVATASPFVANHWLQSSHLSTQTVTQATMLMGLVIGCRWPTGLYQSAVMGAQRLTVSSVITIAMATMGSVGAVLVLAFVSPTIEAFFLWQAFVGATYAFLARHVAWRVIGRSDGVSFKLSRLKRIWRFSVGMSGVAISGLVLMQLDKIILSRFLNLADFGRYTLAALVTSGLYVLLTPVFNVIFPRMSALVAKRDETGLVNLYRTGTRLLSATLFPLAVSLAFFSKDLVQIWTGNADLASSVSPIVSLMLVGTAMNGAMHFPYALQLAHGETRLPLVINVILMSILIPATVFLSLHYGAPGGAGAWALLNLLYLLLGTWLTHRVLLRGIGLGWLFQDVLMPLAISIAVIGSGVAALHQSGYSPYLRLVLAVILAFFAFVSIVLTSQDLKTLAWRRISRTIGWDIVSR